jgi:hypothetical protein
VCLMRGSSIGTNVASILSPKPGNLNNSNATHRVTPRFLPRAWSIGLEFAALVVLLGDYCLQVLAEGRSFIM